MAENSKIEWTDHTFNGWIGCTKVSPGCLNCYAAVSTRARVLRAQGQETWGKGTPRSKTKTWDQPRSRTAPADPKLQTIFGDPPRRPRVFCASLSDWLDDEVPIEWLADLLQLIHDTPNLDWLLLTKRPENFMPRMVEIRNSPATKDHSRECLTLAMDWRNGIPPENVWIGTTVEDQTRADERIPLLLEIPARVRFLSCEPLLGPVNISHIRKGDDEWFPMQHLHWVIAGGESGSGARPMHPDWALSLRDQCQAAGVPFLFKQWGEWHPNCLCPGKGHPNKTIERPSPGSRGVMFRCGKQAGRHLAGRTWDEFPTGESRR